jgi:serine protease Do
MIGALLALGGCASRAAAEAGGDGSPSHAIAAAEDLGRAFASVAKRVSPSVVSVRVESRPEPVAGSMDPFSFFGRGFRFRGAPDAQVQRGMGSGVIVRDDGYVLTNHHVIDGATRIEVELHDGRRVPANVVGSDPATDLAVLKVDATGLPAARFASPNEIEVGQWAIAIGSPFGLDDTITAGVVSAMGRAGLGSSEIEDYIQTDASINPGNSGGPLVNLRGEVIGINTMIIGRGTGIGFAIPSRLAQHVADQLIDSGAVTRAWIGVGFQELTPELAGHFHLDASSTHGALVGSVSAGGPAARAGLREGDVIVSVDGQDLRDGRDLQRLVLAKRVGEPVRLGVVRDGDHLALTLTTGERPSSEALARGDRGGEPGPASVGGLALQPLTPELARPLGLDGVNGALIAAVEPGTAADRAGLREGDVIVEADRKDVAGVDDVREALSDGSALLRVRRGSSSFYAVM